jgi:hypothetical protein
MYTARYSLIQVSGSKNIKRSGSPDSDLDFLWPSGQSGKEWAEQEFLLLIIAALPIEAGLQNE